jgi:hypothetical protein
MKTIENIESLLMGMTFNEVKDALEERGFTCVGKVELMYDDWNVNDTVCEIWQKDGKQVEISPLHEYGNGECFIENDTDIQTIFEAYRDSYEGRNVRCTNLKKKKNKK